MYIQYIRDCIDPDTKELLGRKDERVHVPQSVGENLIFRKVAQRCPRPNYGTPEWTAERQAADAQRGRCLGDVNPGVVGVEWGVQIMNGEPVIVKRRGAETFFFEHQPPTDCPADIVARFNTLDRRNFVPADLNKARQEQADQQTVPASADALKKRAELVAEHEREKAQMLGGRK